MHRLQRHRVVIKLCFVQYTAPLRFCRNASFLFPRTDAIASYGIRCTCDTNTSTGIVSASISSVHALFFFSTASLPVALFPYNLYYPGKEAKGLLPTRQTGQTEARLPPPIFSGPQRPPLFRKPLHHGGPSSKSSRGLAPSSQDDALFTSPAKQLPRHLPRGPCAHSSP